MHHPLSCMLYSLFTSPQRVDGREVYDYRNVNITLASEPGRVEVTLGKTRFGR